MVKLLDQEALVGYVQTDESLQDIHEVLPLLSIFHANTYLWIMDGNLLFCFPCLWILAIYQFYLNNTPTFRSHTCCLCLMAVTQCQQITPKNKSKQTLPLTCQNQFTVLPRQSA